jgi:outer membrane protein assembly factor BamA
MKIIPGYLLCLITLLFAVLGRSQGVTLKVISDDKEVRSLNYRHNLPGRKEAVKELDEIISTLQYRGYLLASADSIIYDTTSVTARISAGQQFKVAKLGLGNLNPNLASRLGISEKLYFGKPFRYRDVARSFEKIITHYEDNGYPFVAVSLDSISIVENELLGVLNVQKNKFFKIDTFRIVGNVRVSKKFLFRYLGIREGVPYNETLIAGLSGKLRQLPFLAETRPLETRLSDKTNRVILFLDKKNASQFDGIIGLLPDAQTKKTVITGDLKLKLVNGIFRAGETFDLEWRRLQSQTQDFNGRVIYPYLFGTPVGTDYNLKIYRRDTTFIDINNNIGLQYYFSGLNNFKVFYRNRTSNLISTSGLDFVTALPDYADITTRSYGVGVFIEKLDYRFNPHKGVALSISGQTGNRTIRQNRDINPVAYENLDLRSVQYQVEGHISTFIRIYGHNVVRLGIQGASVFGSSTIFRNELFRIGGLKTLRGFDEESIFASTFVIPTIEYRFLFSQNSHILIFGEGAFYENNSNRQYMNDTPLSAGAGISFDTKAGILSLSYALGSQFGNGFDLRSGKIHFGLTALF